MTAAIETVVTSGTFSLDGGTWDVDNNVWLIGDQDEVIVLDPAHDVPAIKAAVNGRNVKAILLTHGHDDHVRAAREAAEALDAPVLLPEADLMLWDAVHDDAPDGFIAPGATFEVAGVTLQTLATPGHTPGSTCFWVPELEVVFSGDTLFNGGPGATGRSYSSFDTIIESIEKKLLGLPEDTRVLPGHGDETTIELEAPQLDAWIQRGH